MKHGRMTKMSACHPVFAKKPGIIKAFMQPAKLKKQVKAGAAKTDLQFAPAGKTLVGGTQWSIRLRPGLAAPVIVAKQEKAKVEAVAPTSAGVEKKVKAVKAAEAAKDATVAGWFR